MSRDKEIPNGYTGLVHHGLSLTLKPALVPLEVFKWIGAMFSCTPFSLAGWGLVFALAFTMIPIDMLRKQMVKG